MSYISEIEERGILKRLSIRKLSTAIVGTSLLISGVTIAAAASGAEVNKTNTSAHQGVQSLGSVLAGIAGCEFSAGQVFDTQYVFSGTIPNESLSVSGLNYPYENLPKNQDMTASQFAAGDYFAFKLVSGSYELDLYNASGGLVQEVDPSGTFRASGPAFFFYIANPGQNGTLFTTAGAYNHGDSATFNVTTDYPTTAQMGTYSTCSSKPLTTSTTTSSSKPSPPTKVSVTTASSRLTALFSPFGNNESTLTPGIKNQITAFAKTAVADGSAAKVSWTAGSGAKPTGYTVTATPGGKTCTTTGNTTCTISNLTGGTSYTFAVTATDSSGASAATNAVYVPYLNIALIGYASVTGTGSGNLTLGVNRAASVDKFLTAELASLHATGVKIKSTASDGASHFIGSPTSPANRRVQATLS